MFIKFGNKFYQDKKYLISASQWHVYLVLLIKNGFPKMRYGIFYESFTSKYNSLKFSSFSHNFFSLSNLSITMTCTFSFINLKKRISQNEVWYIPYLIIPHFWWRILPLNSNSLKFRTFSHFRLTFFPK